MQYMNITVSRLVDLVTVLKDCKSQLQFFSLQFLTVYKAYMNEVEFVAGNL